MFRRVHLLAAVGLLCCLAFDGTAAEVRGVIKDSSGAVVGGADVEILSAHGLLLFSGRTDATGNFEASVADDVPGHYQIRASAGGFETTEVVVYLAGEPAPLDITLQPRSVFSRVVVNATRGSAEEAASSPHVALVKDGDESLRRASPTIGGAFGHEAGLLLQESTRGQVSPFLRGMTGYQVLNLVDGIRFNNSTFRSGPNQYLAFIEPMQAQRLEATLGPTGSQYGSDSLGGTIQVLTPQVRFADGGIRRLHGDYRMGGATADLSSHAGGRLSAVTDRMFWLGGISGRRHNDLRAGRGLDSRNVFRRLFGLSTAEVRTMLGSRLQDTGFSQYGLQTKTAVRLRAEQLLTVHYQRGRQKGVRGYKDLLGGLGRLASDFEPQGLHWLYARYEKSGAGFLDSLAATFSLNSQSDGSVRQNLRRDDPVTRDYARVNAWGYSAQGTMHAGRRMIAAFGGEVYDERIVSDRVVRDPLTGSVARPRPLFPDGSRYRTAGLFVHGSFELSRSLRAAGGLRLTAVRFAARADSAYGIPAASQTFRDTTFHTSLSWQIAGALGIHGVVSRGFRAPNLSDLGALGLNDLGYEIPAVETVSAGALVGTDAGEAALSKGLRVRELSAESLLNYEFGVRVTTPALSARAQFFDAELHDPIVRRTLLFPDADVPAHLAGLPVTALSASAGQMAQGVVAVATHLDPRAVKAFVNDGRFRYYGLESLVRWAVDARWTVEGRYAWILGRELEPNRNVRRLPPQAGSAVLRYVPPGRRPWFEVDVAMAGRQARLSGGDRDDERIGASFRRRDIADFFNGGRVAAYLAAGLFLPTGETLQQIQDRVLPIGGAVNGVRIVNDSTRVPLHTSTAGWATISIRSGFRLSEAWQMLVGVENLLDRNFRHHGSGVDGAGINAHTVLSFRF